MVRFIASVLTLAIVISVAACASTRPGHDAAGRYETGVNGGGGE